MTIKTH